MLDARILDLIATVIGCCEEPRETAPGHPPAETVRVLATLRQFLREGTPWRSLRATADKASGSTLRRAFERWTRTGLLRKVHTLLVTMLRGNPTLILDSCSVRAKRGGDLTGPNPTDRGYDAESSRALCRSFGAEPHIHKRRSRAGRGWANSAGRWNAAMPGCWRTSVSPCATTGSVSSFKLCSRPHAYSWLQADWFGNSENRLLVSVHDLSESFEPLTSALNRSSP